MSDKLPRRNFLKLSTLGIGAVGLIAAGCDESSQAQNNNTLLIDVCCDQNTIRFEGPQGPNPDNPIGDPGPHPYYGANFVVQGVIYPGGTLANNPNGGLFADGSPEFPNDVIGRWTCRGWFTGNSNDPARGGIFTPTGPFVTTNQVYDLDLNNPGSQMLTSDGIELIDLNTPFDRAITGGTGDRNGARGTVVQTAIGANATFLFNFTFEFGFI